MNETININGLNINKELYTLIKDEILPGTNISENKFWSSFENTTKELGPKNLACLRVRDDMQEKLDAWYLEKRDKEFSQEEQKSFLSEIGYLVKESEDFTISPLHVDKEITDVAGPQLVVPADNARYALNAANARWGSLLDAYYGTNMIEDAGELVKGKTYNPVRGAKVFKRCFSFLDSIVPLKSGSYAEVNKFALENNALQVTLNSGEITTIQKCENLQVT